MQSQSETKRNPLIIVFTLLVVAAIVGALAYQHKANGFGRGVASHELVANEKTGAASRRVRSDARNPAAALTHSRYQLKFEWLKEPAYNAASGWNNGMTFWWGEIEGDGQIYVPQWEALVVGYGQWLTFQREGDSFMYEEMNQEMHSVMYATRNFLEARALKMAKIANRKIGMDSKRQAETLAQRVRMVEKQKPIRVRRNAINLLAAQNHLKLANAARKQRDFHQVEAQKLLTNYYAELTSARQNGMTYAQWVKIVNLRAGYVGQRNAETNQHYYYLVQYSHYVLYKYRFTW